MLVPSLVVVDRHFGFPDMISTCNNHTVEVADEDMKAWSVVGIELAPTGTGLALSTLKGAR
jgi:hypothetical protein